MNEFIDSMIELVNEFKDQFGSEDSRKAADELLREMECGKGLNIIEEKIMKLRSNYSLAGLIGEVDISEQEFAAIEYFSATRLKDLDDKKNKTDHEERAILLLRDLRKSLLSCAMMTPSGEVIMKPNVEFKLPMFKLFFFKEQADIWMEDEINRLIKERFGI